MKQNRRTAFSLMWKLIELLQPLWQIMSLAVLMGVVGFLLSFGIGLFGAYAILSVFEGADLSGLPFGTWTTKSYFIAMAICAFFRGILHYIEQYCNHFIAFHILAELRVRVFSVMRKLAPTKMEGENQGNLVSMITGDIELLEVFYAHTISPIFIALLTSVFLFCYYLSLDWIYALYSLLGQIFVAVLLPYFASKRASKIGMHLRNQIGALNGEFLDKLRGLREVIQYEQGKEMLAKISALTIQVCEGQKELRKQMASLQAWTDSGILIVSILQILLSFFLIRSGRVGIEKAILAAILQLGSFAPYINLANLGNILSQTLASGERVLSLMEEEPTVVDNKDAKEISSGDFLVQNLSFQYQEEKEIEILKQLDFEIKQGEIVGIMGVSGSGKSTLLKLMMRFWDPSEGRILFHGEDIKNATRSSLYSHYSYMTQETSLFIGSLKENLLLAKPNASEEELWIALKKASFYDVVMQLPNQLESFVEEGGRNFSGGERQRIGLARAFLANRAVFFLDEPTSNVDVQNEAIILKSLLQEREGKTIVLVSHRLSSLGICDRILKMEEGKLLKEIGDKHDALQ